MPQNEKMSQFLAGSHNRNKAEGENGGLNLNIYKPTSKQMGASLSKGDVASRSEHKNLNNFLNFKSVAS